MQMRSENVGGGGSYGFGGDSGMAWIVALFAMFRRDFNNGNYAGAQANISEITGQLANVRADIGDVKYDTVSSILSQTNALMSEMCNGRLENVTAILNQTNQLQSALFGVQTTQLESKYDLASQMAECCCDTNQNILRQGYESQIRTIESVNTLARQQAECCCDTQKLIQQTAFDTQLRDLQNQNSTNQQLTEIKCLVSDTAKDQQIEALKRENERGFIAGEIGRSINATMGHWWADRAFNGYHYPNPACPCGGF